MIVTFRGANHSEFNAGFNVNEAANYGNRIWLLETAEVKHCSCEKQVDTTIEKKSINEAIQAKSYVFLEKIKLVLICL